MDQKIVQALHGVNGWSPALDALAIFCASLLPYFIVFAFIIFTVVSFRRGGAGTFADNKKRLRFLLLTALAVLIAYGFFVSVIRFVYPVARPFAAFGWQPLISHEASNPSFPSGHAVFLFALAMSVWQTSRRWGWYFLAVAALNAVARVFVGVHWPSDILAGALLGIIVAIIITKKV